MIEKNNVLFLANMINNAIPEGYGFCLLLFPLNTEGTMQYVSNGNREDIVNAMKEFINKTDNDNYGKDVQ